MNRGQTAAGPVGPGGNTVPSGMSGSAGRAVVMLAGAGNAGEPADRIAASIYARAEAIGRKVARNRGAAGSDPHQRLDDILTSPWLGFPIMAGLLALVFWITLVGANYPSELLAAVLFRGEAWLTGAFTRLGAPAWLHGAVVLGMYRSVAWVVSVMLPPMAIFFPLFTLLEDWGLLPRVAFNLDRLFRKAGAHGKQALTMCMGFGCNAAGVVSCRIIDSPRERLIAVLTNVFVPCNGRFPTLIALAAIFMGGAVTSPLGTLAAAATVVSIVLVGIGVTLGISWLLSATVLRGLPSFFALELPPFRKPRIGDVLVRSFLDRTAFVLVRAVTVAAPAGLATWVLANVAVGDVSILARTAGWLEPAGRALGLDGHIVLAFLLGLPANEIVLPILIMGYVSAGAMIDPGGLEALSRLLAERGWTWVTALSTMLFSLLHYPCGTTLLTIHRETGRLRWTALSVFLPLGVTGVILFVLNQAVRLLDVG